MKSVLIVSRNFPPLTGGMERLLYHVYLELAKGFRCRVVSPRGGSRFVDRPEDIWEAPLNPVPLFLAIAFLKAFWICLRERPAVILAGSGLAAPVAVVLARIFGAVSVTVVHGLDLVADSDIYQKLFVPFIRRSDYLIANSDNTARLATAAGAQPDKITVIHPGADVEPQERGGSVAGLRKELRLEGAKILLSVGRLIPRKGIAEFIAHAFPAIKRQVPAVKFLIIGDAPENALNRSRDVPAKIRAVIAANTFEQDILLLGKVDDETLARAYRAADLFVFPAIDMEDDVEGFGMVAVEAAAHGLPVVAFAAGGIPDAVCESVSGYLVEPGDYEGLAARVIAFFEGERAGVSRDSCLRHAQRYSWQRYGELVRDFFDKNVFSG